MPAIRWRGLELPSKFVPDQKFKSPTYGKFVIEPFERGMGTTIGNSLRRILLSALEGAAVCNAKIDRVQHEFSTLPGVMEDVTDIILNIKSLIVQITGDCPPEGRSIKLGFQGPGEIVASMIETDPSVRIMNGDQILATLTDKVEFRMDLTVKKGRGYIPASEAYLSADDQPVGVIPVDANYSPVTRVRYAVEETRVGQKTNYDKLILEIWTNGTVAPEMALIEAAKILRKHVNVLLMNMDIGEQAVSENVTMENSATDELRRKLSMSISEMELSVRASNCLESAGIKYLADLVSKSEAELLKVRSFGRTSLREVERKLEELGLKLGTPLPDGFAIEAR
jgi:DNA-directed RNA polymerase subunit alpha